MPEPTLLTTKQCISYVYDLLGRPGDIILPPSVVCSAYWLQLDKIGLRIGLSDRTVFLGKKEFSAPVNQKEVLLEEIPDFGNELALEHFATTAGIESTSPIPVFADMRDKDGLQTLAAYLYRTMENPTQITVGFNFPLQATLNLRLWYEPGGIARPKLGEASTLPRQAQSLCIVNTAFVCLPELVKVEGGEAYFRARKDIVIAEKQEFTKIFENWVMKPPTDGLGHRRAFNEARRGGRRYGGSGSPSSGRGPIIGDV